MTLDRINELASVWQESRAFLAAFQLKLFTHVAAGATSQQVAKKAEADQRAVDRLLNACVAIGLLTKKNDTYFNTPDGEKYLVEGAPQYKSNLFHTAHTFQNWGTLDTAARRGTSAISVEWDSDDRRADFIEAMHRRAQETADPLIKLVDVTDVRKALDIGGGSGVFSIAMCRANPQLSAVVFDLPEVTLLTRQYIARAELEQRISTIDGNYLYDDFRNDFDLVFLSAIVHINSPEENADIVRRASAALNPGGRIAIQDFIMDDDRSSPKFGALFALNMLVSTRAGDTYTEAEVRSWLAEAGLKDIIRIPSGPNTSLIIGTKP